MKNLSVRNIVLAGFFLAVGIVLPFFTMQIPSIGNMLLPMHIPVLICGFVCGWPLGLIVGFILPLLRSMLFTMPPMYPTALAMAFELAAYGALTGLFYNRLAKKPLNTYIALGIAMIGGRVIWGIISAILYGMAGQPFGFAIFIAGAFTNAIPGIILQLIVIPILIMALENAHLMISALVTTQLEKYPQMKAQDIIKLIYQNEFGGGHMIDDPETSLKRLKDEAKQLKNNSFIEEDIGNDLVRVYLGNAGELELLTLNQLFVYSAKLMNGSIISFINKLEQLKSACQRGTISFDYRQICLEIENYEKLNYPPISHSSTYRELYQPHYRVINKQI